MTDREDDLAGDLARGWREAEIAPRLRALLAYAEKLSRRPGDVEEEDLDRLREAGLDDEAILHLCEVVSYFNFVNRMADGLGVSLEAHWRHPPVAGEREGGG